MKPFNGIKNKFNKIIQMPLRTFSENRGEHNGDINNYGGDKRPEVEQFQRAQYIYNYNYTSGAGAKSGYNIIKQIRSVDFKPYNYKRKHNEQKEERHKYADKRKYIPGVLGNKIYYRRKYVIDDIHIDRLLLKDIP